MTNVAQINYSEQIRLACLTIHAPLETVKSLFVKREQYEIYYLQGDKREISLEVRLDLATLICLFDSHNICEGVYLFQDELIDMIHSIEYCNKTYPFDISLTGWVVNDLLIQVNADNKQSSFLILPIKKEKDL